MGGWGEREKESIHGRRQKSENKDATHIYIHTRILLYTQSDKQFSILQC